MPKRKSGRFIAYVGADEAIEGSSTSSPTGLDYGDPAARQIAAAVLGFLVGGPGGAFAAKAATSGVEAIREGYHNLLSARPVTEGKLREIVETLNNFHYNKEHKLSSEKYIKPAVQAEAIADYIAFRLMGGERPENDDFILSLMVFEALRRKVPSFEALVAAASKDPSLSLPSSAPASWKTDKRPDETPPEFIQRVYGEWMGKGLTLADVRRLDEPLAQSYYYHLRKSRPLPEGFDLPTKPQHIDRELERLESGGVLGEFTAREARRLSSALSRRGK